jgi:hypothetical protein
MSDEAENQGGPRDSGCWSGPYARAENVKSFWRAIAGGGILAIVVTLFIALGVANRDYAKQVGDNLQRLGDQWNRNFEKLTDRVFDLEKWAAGKGKR